MGASYWEYYVPYQANLVAALDELRARILREGQFLWRGEWAPDRDTMPATEDELWEDELRGSGTHSILDVFRVIDADEMDDFGTVRPLTESEVTRHFGRPRPSRATFERVANGGSAGAPPEILDGPRWSAYCTVLYSEAGEPAELVFWGFSGD